ncbi:MAG: hypothetical protein HC945_02525 [Nitrosarchaeum sp.]|nr:hypothetical protein [Nitrosarchaeum sp.]
MRGEMRPRRAQAALEYLVTYGWGFLVILVVIGSLAYYGILTPSQYFPERCEFGSQLICEDYQLLSGTTTGGSNEVYLQLRNNFGKAINITSGQIFAACADENLLEGANHVTIPPGRKGEVKLLLSHCPVEPTARYLKGDKELVSIILTFQRNESGAPQHNLTGELFAKAR